MQTKPFPAKSRGAIACPGNATGPMRHPTRYLPGGLPVELSQQGDPSNGYPLGDEDVAIDKTDRIVGVGDLARNEFLR